MAMRYPKWLAGGILALAVLSGGAWASDTARVTLRGQPVTLTSESALLQAGQTLPDLSLPDASMNRVDLKSLRGKVTVVSIVPSLDTPTCEEQTHLLSETSGDLALKANLITISRDLPFAQKRFAREAKISNVRFLSDYRDAGFGRASGLLIAESRLLTRAVLVLDRDGVIRYMEIVSELASLPDMKRAFAEARNLLP